MTARQLLLLLALPLGTPLGAQQPVHPARPVAPVPLTRPERTDYRETSRYEDVMDLLRAVTREQRRMFLTQMGYTGETRAIPLVVAGSVADGSPEAVRRAGRLVVYIQANIHAGEVEGKEAAQILLRDIAAGKHPRWLDSLVLLVAPDYNADGNERVSLTSRPFQFGPVGGTGQRANAAGLDLNRDHMKLESPEARSQVLLLRQYGPQLALDLHTTDGSTHGYYLTYAEPLHPATDTAITGLLRRDLLPQVTRRVKQTDGWDLFYYGDFPDSPVDRGGGGTAPGWYSFDHRPRFSENYWGLRGIVGILAEAYSYASFQDRIHATVRFLEETLDYAAAHATAIRRLADAAARHSVVGESLAVRARVHRGGDIDVLVGQVAEERNPYTGQRMLRRLPETRVQRMPDYTTFEAAESVRAPLAYFIPAGLAAALERLQAHGIEVTRLDRPLVLQAERFRVDSTWTAVREFQGHRERTVTGAWESAEDTLPAGMAVVRVDQALGRLAVELLEPRADDGLLDWNVFDQALAGARYYPVKRTSTPF